MEPDLQGLEISKGELKHLSGMDIEDLTRPASLKNTPALFNFLFQEILTGIALTPIVVGFLYIFIIGPTMGASVPVAIACLIIVPILIVLIRWFWLKHNTPQTLIALLDEIDQYHAVIKAIDISDHIEAAGSLETCLSDRHTVIEALKLTRSDLVRALKTERVLRDNKDFIAKNPELLVNNLTAISALRISNQASEYNLFLNQALEIGLSIQSEMRKLQSQHSNNK